jgi:hypothetical protein
MALSFALGSVCFLVGPLPGYVDAVGVTTDAVTFFVGSLLFTAGGALQTGGVSNPHYDQQVWRPDLFGSTCFLVSGAIAYRASRRHGWLPARDGHGWWQPAVNLIGCVFFGVAALAGYVLPATGSILSQAIANVTICAGAACFLACALATLRPSYSPRS